MKRVVSVNELAARSYKAAIEYVGENLPLGGDPKPCFALVLYREGDPHSVNVVSSGSLCHTEVALLVAREKLLNGNGSK